jgi:hypothetical protein
MFANDFDSVAEGLGYRISSKSLNRMSLKQIQSIKKLMAECPSFMKPLLSHFNRKELAGLRNIHSLTISPLENGGI